jgi:acetyltransferase-like isoleucine patch superfamily enzyme
MFRRIHNLIRKAIARVFTRLMSVSFRHFGAGSRLRPPLRLKGEQHVTIGANVFIGPNSWIEVFGDPGDDSPVIEIGSGTEIVGFCTINGVSKVVIENDVLIARYVYIADHSHEYRDPNVPISRQGLRNIAPVRIRSGAWLGQGAVICPGVTIGRNSVVGANSVVISDVPDHCVASGVPARVIRRIGDQTTPG